MPKFFTIKLKSVPSDMEKFLDAFNVSKCRDANIAKVFYIGLLALSKKRYSTIENITCIEQPGGKYAKAGQMKLEYHSKWNEEPDNIVNQYIIENDD